MVRLSSPSRAASQSAPRALGLVHLAVAHERPDPRLRGIHQPPRRQVAVEARLVDGRDGTQPHGNRGELPEPGQETWVRIGREATAPRGLAPEVVQLLLLDATLQEGACIDARRGVALEVDLVARARLAAALEEVVEAHLVERRGRGIRGDVPSDAFERQVGAHHHGHGVPADDAADALLHVEIARKRRLVLHGDGVHVVGGEHLVRDSVQRVGPAQQAVDQKANPLPALLPEHGVERLDPFPGLDRIAVGHGFTAVGWNVHVHGLVSPEVFLARHDRDLGPHAGRIHQSATRSPSGTCNPIRKAGSPGNPWVRFFARGRRRPRSTPDRPVSKPPGCGAGDLTTSSSHEPDQK